MLRYSRLFAACAVVAISCATSLPASAASSPVDAEVTACIEGVTREGLGVIHSTKLT